MRIVQLTPGTGNFHCGSCLRDSAMVLELRRLGHDVLMVPLYLPHVTDGPDTSDTPVFFGGINVYLQQKSAIFRHTPRWVDKMLDRPRLLKWAADRSGMTSGEVLGELTVSMLRGEEGKQNKELDRLTAFLKSDGGVDVVSLSNGLLIGMAARIKRELGAKVVCTLAGEAPFLDSLIEPYRARSWELMRQRASDVDMFLPVTRYYANLMGERMKLEDRKSRVVHIGLDPDAFTQAAPPPEPTIGYMAYLYEGEGLDVLADAFIELHRRGNIPKTRLRIAGAMMPRDRQYVDSVRERLNAAGLNGKFEILPNITGEQKRDFLAGLSVLSVPAVYGESFGLYVLEAWASGVPVVQPRHAGFVELLERAKGGIFCEPGDPRSLADGLESLLGDGVAAREMGNRGLQAVREYFNVHRMAREVVEICEGLSHGV